MRAVVVEKFGSIEGLGVLTVPDPVPRPGEIVIAVEAAGVSYADMLVIEGKYQNLPAAPFVPGKEVAGTVVAVGPDVSGLAEGDRVLAFVDGGGYAERAVAPAGMCFRLPPRMPFDVAAAMGISYQTAWMALVGRAVCREGEVVLVNGASGGVGLAAVDLATALGAKVVAGLTTPAKADAARAAGAAHIVDLSAANLRDSLRAQLTGGTGGRLADVVVDPVGGEVFEASLRALAWEGRLVVVGFTSGEVPAVRTNYLLIKNIAVTGLFWNTYRQNAPETITAAQRSLFRLYEEGRLRPRVMRRFPLDRASEALCAIRDRQVSGRVVLVPSAT
ncbi:MAG: NADPH:quinone oxidoreductase family protein [Acetobacterales bacterium]